MLIARSASRLKNIFLKFFKNFCDCLKFFDIIINVMTKTQIYKYTKANQACKKFLKASYGVSTFLTTILANLNCGKIKKVQSSFSKVQEFLSPEDYNSFKADMLSFRGHFLDDSKDLVAKWEDKLTEYFKK